MESADVTTGVDDKGQFAGSRGVSVEVDDHASNDSTSGATSNSETNRAQPETEVALHETEVAPSGAASTAETVETPIEVEDYGTSRSKPAEAPKPEIGHEVEDLDSGVAGTSEPAEPQAAKGVDSETDGADVISRSQPAGAQSETGEYQEAGSSSSQFQVRDFQNRKEKELLDQGAKSVEAAENAARQAEQGSIGSLNGLIDYEERQPRQRDQEIQLAMRMADAVEEDAHAVAKSLTTLLSSLRSALSEVTKSSVANMRVENETAGQVQDAAIDAASKGNRFINDCLRLNEDLKGMERVAAQIEALKAKVDHVESQASRYLSR